MILQLFLYVGLFVTKQLGVMIAIWFVFGFLQPISIGVGFVYLMELLP